MASSYTFKYSLSNNYFLIIKDAEDNMYEAKLYKKFLFFNKLQLREEISRDIDKKEIIRSFRKKINIWWRGKLCRDMYLSIKLKNIF